MALKTSWQKYSKSTQMKIKWLNRVENIMAKGEIAHYEQFLLLPQHYFQKLSAAEASESVCMRERDESIYCL